MTRTVLTGPVLLPDGTVPENAQLTFSLRQFDTKGEQIFLGSPLSFALDVDGHPVDCELEATEDMDQGYSYAVGVAWYSPVTRRQEALHLGYLAVPLTGPADIAGLLVQDVTEPVATDVLTAALAAVSDAQEARDDAQAAATNAVIGAPYGFRTIAALKANVSLSYSTGAGLIQVATGDRYLAGGFWFEVVGSSDSYHVANSAAGTPVRFVIDRMDEVDAWGPEKDGATSDATLINLAVTTGQQAGKGALIFGAGEYAFDADLDLHQGTTNGELYRGYSLKGAGVASFRAFDGTPVQTQGTTLRFDAGMVMTFGDAVAMSISDMNIIGEVEDDALIDMETAFAGGGISNALIINDIQATPSGEAVAVRVGGFFTTTWSATRIIGHADFRTVYAGAATPSANMFFGIGLQVTGDDQGAGGVVDGLNVHGFALGIELGKLNSDYVGATNIARVEFRQLQVSYCQGGWFHGKGVDATKFVDAHFENGLDYYGKVAGDRVNLLIEGGQSGGASRTVSGTPNYMKLAHFVIGDATDSDSTWGVAWFLRHAFKTVNQAGVLVYGGADAGDTILEDCIAEYNGGRLVVIDRTNGLPNVWIRNLRRPTDGGKNPFTADQLVAELELNATPYLRHVFTGNNLPFLARIENCEGASGLLDADVTWPTGESLDLATRKFPPAQCSIASGSRTMTLGDGAQAGLPMVVDLQGGSLSVVIPSGTVLSTVHGLTVAPGTITLTSVAKYRFVREGAGWWDMQVTVPAAQASAMTASKTLDAASARINTWTPDAARNVFLPPLATHAGYQTRIRNTTGSGFNITVKDSGNTTTVATVAPGEVWDVWMDGTSYFAVQVL